MLVDSMFLNGSLHPLAVHAIPLGIPSWIKAGVVQDQAALQALVLKGIDSLMESLPTAAASHKEWSEFAKRYGEILARVNGLNTAEEGEHLSAIRNRIKTLQTQSDERLMARVAAVTTTMGTGAPALMNATAGTVSAEWTSSRSPGRTWPSSP